MARGEPASTTSDGSGPVDVVIPTFHRDAMLGAVFASLAPHADIVGTVYVIDSGSSPTVETACETAGRELALTVTYVDAGGNIGPAGAMAEAFRQASRRSPRAEWLLRLDDDRPLPEGLLPDLLDEARDLVGRDAKTAAVGLSGARWHPRRARLIAPDWDQELVSVDYLATGQFPLFRLSVMEEVGPFREDLFFGMTEVEYGVRASDRGFSLYVPGRLRPFADPGGAYGRPTLKPRTDWRAYYAIRNLVVLLRSTGHPWIAARIAVSRGVAKPLLVACLSPRTGRDALALSLRGVRDAYRGNMGCTVDPWTWAVDRDDESVTTELPPT